jgi:hypothetical protein
MKIYLLGERTIEIPWQYNYENNKITLDTKEITPSNITTKGAWVFKLDNYINYIQK